MDLATELRNALAAAAHDADDLEATISADATAAAGWLGGVVNSVKAAL